MKHNIISQDCAGCGIYLYPPTEVSDIGQESYELIFKAPTADPEKVPTDNELVEINKDREAAGLPSFASVGEWTSDYRSWALDLRDIVRSRAQNKSIEIGEKIREPHIVEGVKSLKLLGKRWKTVYEAIPTGWRLKCPNCGLVTLEWKKSL